MINGGGSCGNGDGVIMKVMAMIITDDVSYGTDGDDNVCVIGEDVMIKMMITNGGDGDEDSSDDDIINSTKVINASHT